ncbi:MAG: hypothetical protein AAGI45_12680 [Cyanobacteria bacterium P01_H01_bin.26]
MNPSYDADSARNPVRSDPSYAPSVPVSVYRELAAELQATKAMVDSLSAQNTHLNQQNHLLRQNIHQMVQVALQLGHHAGVTQPVETEVPPLPSDPYDLLPQERRPEPISEARPRVRPKPKSGELSKLFTEQAGENRRYSLDPAASSNLGTLWLIVSIAVIILTAFGAGFLIMRPLLNDR